MAQVLKNLPAMQETRAFNPWKIPWRGGWFPTPAFFPGESHGQRSLADCSPEVTQSDITERLTLSLHTVFRFFFMLWSE